MATLALVNAAAAQAPTPEETLALEYLNRFRSEPAEESRRIHAEARPSNSSEVDWDMFLAETSILEPAAPVFFDVRLVAACRAHAAYVLAHREWGHRETPGRSGFTGEYGADRARHFGYSGDDAWECTGASARTPRETVASLIVDAGPGGEGGMQKGRGHRATLIRHGFRDVGIGFKAFGGGRLSSVQLFGRSSPERRLVGGVVIRDADDDGFYDVGEGLGGVHVAASDGSSTITWPSGAYTLRLRTASTAPLDVVLTLGSIVEKARVPEGTANAKVDFRPEVDERRERLLAILGGDGAARRDSLSAAIELELLGGNVPEVARADVERFTAARSELLTALDSGEGGAVRKHLASSRREYGGGIAAGWFDGFARLDELTRSARRLEGGPSQAWTKLLARVRRAMAETAWPDLFAQLAALAASRPG